MTGKTTFLFATGLLLLSAAALAAATRVPSLDEASGRYRIAPSSQIRFSVGQVGGGGIFGQFGQFSGDFQLDNHDITRSVVQFLLYPASVKTGEPRVENFLKSSAVFDTEKYDVIRFASTRITRTGEDTADVEGNLTARGITRTEHFQAKLTEWNHRAISLAITGGVYRSRYNMDVGTPIYSNIVAFNLTINGEQN